MDRSEITIGAEDLDEIFGMGNPQKLSDVKEKISEEIPKSKLIVKSKMAEAVIEPGNNADELIARAKQLEAENSEIIEQEEDTESKEYVIDFYSETNILEIFEISESVSKAVSDELKKSIDEKAVNKMMLKTLEKTALENIILKNTNWNGDGKLREDGSMDIERALRNVRELAEDPEGEIARALYSLLQSRLNAVKRGVGLGEYIAVKRSVEQKLKIINAGYRKDNVAFFDFWVMDAINKTGDE